MRVMRGIYTSVNDIRKRVFAEIAKLSYEYKDGDLSQMDHIPYRVIPGEVTVYRDSVFIERAIVAERMRLAMGLPARNADEMAPVSQGAEEAVQPEKYYQPPLINIIKFACHKKTLLVAGNNVFILIGVYPLLFKKIFPSSGRMIPNSV